MCSARRPAGLLLGSVKGHYRAAGLKAVFGTIRLLPSTVKLRRSIQRRRVRSDAFIVGFASANKTFFDAVTYEPINRPEATAYATLQRSDS